MTSKRGPTADSPFFNQRAEADTPSTLRSIEVAEDIALEAELEQAPVYYEPQPLVSASDHKTIEIETIKLADDIDPRKLPTELRLRPVAAPPPDSGWPQTDVVVVSSQPPLASRRRWRAPLALLVLLGALALLLVLRGIARRSQAAAQPFVSAAPTDVAPAPVTGTTAVVALPPAPTVEAAPAKALPDAPTSAAPPAPALPAPKEQRHASPPRQSARSSSSADSPGTDNGTSAAQSPSKPKRAIY